MVAWISKLRFLAAHIFYFINHIFFKSQSSLILRCNLFNLLVFLRFFFDFINFLLFLQILLYKDIWIGFFYFTLFINFIELFWFYKWIKSILIRLFFTLFLQRDILIILIKYLSIDLFVAHFIIRLHIAVWIVEIQR